MADRERGAALLAAVRESAEQLDRGRVDVLLDELQTRLHHGAVAATLDVPMPALPGAGARLWAALAKPWLAGASLALLVPVLYLALPVAPRRQPAPSQPAEAARQAEPVSDVVVQPIATPANPTVADAAGGGAEPAPTGRAIKTRRALPVAARVAAKREAVEASPLLPPDTIDAELSLLQRANAELRRGDARAALVTLADAARDHPHGKLQHARTLTRVLALCAAGERDAARTLAAGFTRAHPGTPYAARLVGACQ